MAARRAGKFYSSSVSFVMKRCEWYNTLINGFWQLINGHITTIKQCGETDKSFVAQVYVDGVIVEGCCIDVNKWFLRSLIVPSSKHARMFIADDAYAMDDFINYVDAKIRRFVGLNVFIDDPWGFRQ